MAMCKTLYLLIMSLILLLNKFIPQGCEYADYVDYEEVSDELLDSESYVVP